MQKILVIIILKVFKGQVLNTSTYSNYKINKHLNMDYFATHLF